MLRSSASPRSSVLLLFRAASTVNAIAAAAAPVDTAVIARSIYDMAAPPQVVVFATGGGMQLASSLLTTPGSSRSVLDVQLPYSRASLVQILGREPAKYCSSGVAHDLAAAAFERAKALRETDGPAFGVGCTAALRSEPMKRGHHRCFVAVRTSGGTHEVTLTLAKGSRTRVTEDAVVSRVALVTLARACGLELTAEQLDSWRLDPDGDAPTGSGAQVALEKLEVSFTPVQG